MVEFSTLKLPQLLSMAGRASAEIRRRARPDHSTIGRAQVRFVPQAMLRYYLYIAVGPSRRRVRAWDEEIVARAQTFAHAVDPADWTAVPHLADAVVTTFAQLGEDGNRDRALHVGRDGLIELLWALKYEDDGTQRTLDTCEISGVARAFAAAVSGEEYDALCRPRWRRPVRKLDWHLGVSTAVVTESGQREWMGLRFTSDQPRRAEGARANMPPEGYGRETLRSARRRSARTQIPEVLLQELLAANGYYGFDVRQLGAAERETPA